MSLPLCADAGGESHSSTRLHGDPRALVRADPGPFYICHYAQAQTLAGGSRPWLLFLQKLLVVDHPRRHRQRRLIVAAVVRQWLKVLKDDLVVVREILGSEKVLAANLEPVDSHFAGSDVEQSLDHEHAVLPSSAAHRCHDRLRREDGGELAVVARNLVRAEQRALAVDRHRETIGIVGAGVMDEHVMHAEDLAVLVERYFGIVDLATLLRRRREVFAAIFDPFDGPIYLARDPGDHDLLRVVHHDLRAETAADEGRDHPNLRLRQSEHRREPVANRDRRLGGVPDRHLFGSRVPLRNDRAVLDRPRNTTVLKEPPLDDAM